MRGIIRVLCDVNTVKNFLKAPILQYGHGLMLVPFPTILIP